MNHRLANAFLFHAFPGADGFRARRLAAQAADWKQIQRLPCTPFILSNRSRVELSERHGDFPSGRSRTAADSRYRSRFVAARAKSPPTKSAWWKSTARFGAPAAPRAEDRRPTR